MSVQISTSIEDDFGLVHLAGKLTLSPQLNSLRDEARKLLKERPLRGLILVVSEIAAVDSAGLGELTIVYSVSSRNNCGMELVGVSPSFAKVLEITRLDAILTSSPDLESAKKRLRMRASGSGS